MIADYLVPRNLEEAMAIQMDHPGRVRFLAGGTDSFSGLSQAARAVVTVDISDATDLNYTNRNGEDIEIGAATTLSGLLRTTWVAEEIPALAEAVSRVATPQIRNQGTVVGNILTGRAVADVKVCTSSLGAFLRIKGPKRERTIKIDKLGDRGHELQNDEIAVSLVIPRKIGSKASAYCCFTPRRAFSYASASASASVTVDRGRFTRVSLVVSPIHPALPRSGMKPCNTCAGSCRICKAMHLSELEQNLVDRPAREKEIEQVCNMFEWQTISMRDSPINGIADYRRHLLKVLSKKALASALQRFKRAR